jgi:DUF971 family protein
LSSSNPRGLKKVGQTAFRIQWDDGHESEYPVRYLRLNCRCAACINEMTGEKMLNPDSIPEEVKCLDVQLVGNYALHFRFSDGHETGIYPFKTLREICPCAECAE